jgi:hypothetical protein
MYDLYYILQHYSIPKLVDLYRAKFKKTDAFPMLKSLTYFGDADDQLPPMLLKDKKLKWPQVKKFIVSKVNEYVA